MRIHAKDDSIFPEGMIVISIFSMTGNDRVFVSHRVPDLLIGNAEMRAIPYDLQRSIFRHLNEPR